MLCGPCFALEEQVLLLPGGQQNEAAGPSDEGSLPQDLSLGRGRASMGGGWQGPRVEERKRGGDAEQGAWAEQGTGGWSYKEQQGARGAERASRGHARPREGGPRSKYSRAV
ncbi:hypothetical protein NDU88_004555 [Pleurodeles waltl]|uniref:Uncharacterized protein n=1 Tax=Pleurodeles waltl TaxID=8319 RepID=A0AAV7TSX2_PLEWA|nr:hypothetical protein NDU88_004555 [Pleurodeles waltl]